MTTLEDARDWYRSAREAGRYLDHLAKFWDGLPWEQEGGWVDQVNRDNVLRHATGRQMGRAGRVVLAGLDDLAVLLMFSVFEATVRTWVGNAVKDDLDRLREPGREAILQEAAEDIGATIQEGSFGRLLDPYKQAIPKELVSEVMQVKEFRNWVAHGRRPDGKNRARITPEMAYDRLARFLAALRGPTA